MQFAMGMITQLMQLQQQQQQQHGHQQQLHMGMPALLPGFVDYRQPKRKLPTLALGDEHESQQTTSAGSRDSPSGAGCLESPSGDVSHVPSVALAVTGMSPAASGTTMPTPTALATRPLVVAAPGSLAEDEDDDGGLSLL